MAGDGMDAKLLSQAEILQRVEQVGQRHNEKRKNVGEHDILEVYCNL